MPPETPLSKEISIKPYQDAFRKSTYFFYGNTLLRPGEIDLDGRVPVIQISSERGRPIEIPENIQKLLDDVSINSQALMAHEVAFFPDDIFMVLETKNSHSPRIFGVVFNFKEKIFFSRELSIEDTKSTSPLLKLTEERSPNKDIKEEDVRELASFVRNVSQQPNFKYSLHRKINNKIEIFSSFHYFVITESVTGTSSQVLHRMPAELPAHSSNNFVPKAIR